MVIDSVRTRTVVVADEFTLARDGVVAICERSQRYRVIDGLADGPQTLQAITTLHPDAAVVDLLLPELSGLEVIRAVRAANCHTKLILLTARVDRQSMMEALRAGADGFLLKSCTGKQLVEALDQVTNGGVYVTPFFSLDDLTCGHPRKDSRDPLQLLSSREYQVFTLLVDGVRAKEIAARLDVSPKTVDTHRASLMRKLNIYDVPGLVKFAINRRLTSAG